MSIEITEKNFQELVMDSDKPVLVDFWASWCGPCRAVGPIIEELAEEFEGKAVIGKVNVDEQPALAERFRVMSIPTIVFFKHGEAVETLIGARPYEELAAELDKIV